MGRRNNGVDNVPRSNRIKLNDIQNERPDDDAKGSNIVCQRKGN